MLPRISPLRVLFAAVVLIGAVAPSQAAVVTYLDRTAWTAAVPGATTIDFEGLIGDYFPDFLVDGVTFKDADGPLKVTDSMPGDPVSSNTGVSGQHISKSTIVATLPAGTMAFGVDMMTAPRAGGVVSVAFGGFTFPVETSLSAAPPWLFFGVRSDSPIDAVTFTYDVHDTELPAYLNLDNFSYPAGTVPGPIPEPGTLLLVGTGLLGAARLRRRR